MSADDHDIRVRDAVRSRRLRGSARFAHTGVTVRPITQPVKERSLDWCGTTRRHFRAEDLVDLLAVKHLDLPARPYAATADLVAAVDTAFTCVEAKVLRKREHQPRLAA